MKAVPCRTIGVIGAGRGCGVTHLTVWIANWLFSVQQEKTAVLEWNSHGDFMQMVKLCHAQTGRAGAEVVLGVDYYPVADADTLSLCLGKTYQRILIDYGEITKEGIREWIRCDKKIVVAALSEWRLQCFLDMIVNLESFHTEWVCASAFGSEETRCSIEKELRIKIYRIPFSVDAFRVTRKDMDFLKNIVKDQC